MIAIIPARGGSKGLPGKNIKILNGKPLIAYTIEAAKKSKYIDRVVVTTDDEKIAEAAKKYGAELPFMRPAELSTDTASAVDVYLHAVEFLKEENQNIEKFMVLLPTAPLRNEKNIDEAVELFQEKEARTLISVKEAETPISWYYAKNANGYIENAGFENGLSVANRQMNRKFYIPNGAIYILDYHLLKEERTYYCDDTIGYVMDREHSVDIDEMIDFKLAEVLMQK